MLKNITIKMKLRLVVIILAMLVILTSIAFLFIVNQMINTTTDLFDHPFTVSNLSLDIESDVRHLYSITEEITETTDSVLRDQFIEEAEALELEVQNHIDEIKPLYLGDPQDVQDIENELIVSNNYRDIAIAFMMNGQYDEAFNYRSTTLKDYTNNQVMTVEVVGEFANNKAIELTNEAIHLNGIYQNVVYSFAGGMVLLSIVFSTLLIHDISPEINQITKTIKSQGKTIDTLDLNRKDELGVISRNLRDMLENMKTQQEIKELSMKLANLQDKEYLRITLMSIGDGVITTNLDGIITNINPIASMLTEYSAQEAIGKNSNEVFVIVNKHSREAVNNPIDQVIQTGKTVGLANHTVLISKYKKEYDISDSGAPIIDDDGTIIGVVLVFRDVTKEYESRKEIEYLSWHDKLTGLKNRNYLEKELLKLQESKAKNVGIIMGDVNGLKITNDAFGHTFGDQLLKEIGIILNASTPDNTIISRWGGDEFVLVLQDANEDSLNHTCKQIQELSDTYESKSPVKPSVSLGHAILNEADMNLYQALIRAEDMMYENKLLDKDSLRSKIVSSLEASLYEKSYETEEHALRVATYAEIIARKINLHQNEINNVILLSKLHDIGKISIDDSILQKPASLIEQEWKIIKKHPETGYRIASSLNDLTHIAEGILCHHEHYDGNGYPRGLSGEDIPISARIVSIADSFDVMITERNYKKTLSRQEAIDELIRCKEKQFDPLLVDVFIGELKTKTI